MNVHRIPGGVALILACASAFAQRTGPHWQDGGVDGVTRANYTVTSTNGLKGEDGTIVLPHGKSVYLLPLSVTTFAESGDFTLMPNGVILVNTTGLYRVAICIDWKAQDNKDINLRYVGLGRIGVGATLGGHLEGGLLNISNQKFDRLAVADMPASDSPTHVRGSWSWTPGTLEPGQGVTLDVTLPQAGLIGAGDQATASHTALVDSVIGAGANAAIDISARVVGADTVRVLIENRRGAVPVTIPDGTLNVLANSATTTRGESADAWNVLQTPSVLLYAGEQVFGIWRSDTAGDYLQTTFQTYVQIEHWHQGSVARR